MNAFNLRIIALIIALLIFPHYAYADDVMDISSPYGGEKIFQLCKNNVFVKGIINGQTLIKPEHSSCNYKRIVISDVTGGGILTIEMPDKGSLILKKIILSQLNVQANNVEEFTSIPGEMKLRELDLSVTGNSGRVIINSNVSIERFALKVLGSLKELSIQEEGIKDMQIFGNAGYNRKKPFIHSININRNESTYSKSNILTQYRHKKTSLDDVAVGEISLSDPYFHGEAKNIAQTTYTMSNIDVFGRGIRIALGQNIDSIELRDVFYRPKKRGRLKIELTNDDVGKVVVAEIHDVHELVIKSKVFPDELIISSITANNVTLDLPNGSDKEIPNVTLGSMSIGRSIKSKEHTLFLLADHNLSRYPHEVLGVYDLIIKKGYAMGADGTVEFPRLKALQRRQLKELSYRPISDRIFGRIVYYLTGFGTTVLVPMITWVGMVLLFAVCYLFAWNHVTLTRMCDALWGSLKFSCSFGFPSETHMLKHIDEYSSTTNCKKVKALRKLAHIQGIFGIIQLTLLSIYFSQTTIP